MLYAASAVTLITLLHLLNTFGKSTATLDESSLDMNNNDIDGVDSFDYNTNNNKRSYTYVSEFKRLPVYNFGLGKRRLFSDKRIKPYSFGLGKRSKGFNFGVGKKGDPLMDMDYQQLNSYPLYLHPDVSNLQKIKRYNRVYNFGLGKRLPESTFDFNEESLNDNNKRGNEDASRKYAFGLGKKSVNDQEIMESEK